MHAEEEGEEGLEGAAGEVICQAHEAQAADEQEDARQDEELQGDRAGGSGARRRRWPA